VVQIKNGIPFTKLKVQHRMRPCMADLLRLSIYKDLEDHASVQNYENMVGVEKNMYFINHTEPEDEDLDGKSKVSAAILLS